MANGAAQNALVAPIAISSALHQNGGMLRAVTDASYHMAANHEQSICKKVINQLIWLWHMAAAIIMKA